MKKLITVFIIFIVIAGCSTEGKIKVINRTENILYFSMKGNSYELPGASLEMITDGKGTTKTVSFDTGKKFLMFESDETKIVLSLIGETFIMNYGDTITTVQVEPNETYKVYADPTHACVKVINNSNNDIIELKATRLYNPNNSDINDVRILSTNIPDGSEFYKQIDYVSENATTDEVFYYKFEITFSDSSMIEYGSYGDLNFLLKLDDLYLIDLN